MPDEHVSLKEHFESLLDSHEQRHVDLENHRVELRDLLQRALDGVADALKEYKSASNEWRGTLNDMIQRHPDRNELVAVREKLETEISVAVNQGATAFATIGQKVDELRSSDLLQAGAKERGSDFTKWFFALAGLICIASGTVIAALVAF